MFRHLVQEWLKPVLPPSPTSPKSRTTLSRISHLVLLDLLGAPNPVIRSFYPSTGWLFDEFHHAEDRLGRAGLLWPGVTGNKYAAKAAKLGAIERSFFVPRQGAQTYGGGIEDDHLPFVANGVPVVHLITLPFPSVWHTIAVSLFLLLLSFPNCIFGAGKLIDSALTGRRDGARPADGQGVELDRAPHRRRVPGAGTSIRRARGSDSTTQIKY